MFENIEAKSQFEFEVNCRNHFWVIDLSDWFWLKFECFLAILKIFLKFFGLINLRWMFENIAAKSKFILEVNAKRDLWVIDL